MAKEANKPFSILNVYQHVEKTGFKVKNQTKSGESCAMNKHRLEAVLLYVKYFGFFSVILNS